MKTLKTILQEVISGIKAWVDANTVHKSGTETIDGTKTFSAPQCYSSNAILFNSSVLPTQNTVPSGTINPLRQYVGYGASYANSVFIHDTEMRSNGRNHYRWTIYSDDHSANMGMWLVYNPDSEYLRYLDLKGSFVPDSDGTYHLGIPTQRWKTLNGINPGALSLPDMDSTVSRSTELATAIDKTQTANSWTADFTGILRITWFVKNLTGPFRCSVFNNSDLRYATWGQTFSANDVWYFIVSFPVQNGKTYYFDNSFTRTSEDTSPIVYGASAVYCLGNV